MTVNVNVKLSPCLTKHHAMKAHWRVEVQLHAFFDLGTRKAKCFHIFIIENLVEQFSWITDV